MRSSGGLGLSILGVRVLNLGASIRKAIADLASILVIVFDGEIVKTTTSFLAD